MKIWIFEIDTELLAYRCYKIKHSKGIKTVFIHFRFRVITITYNKKYHLGDNTKLYYNKGE